MELISQTPRSQPSVVLPPRAPKPQLFHSTLGPGKIDCIAIQEKIWGAFLLDRAMVVWRSVHPYFPNKLLLRGSELVFVQRKPTTNNHESPGPYSSNLPSLSRLAAHLSTSRKLGENRSPQILLIHKQCGTCLLQNR